MPKREGSISGVSNSVVNTGFTGGNITNTVQTVNGDEVQRLRELLQELRGAVPQLNLAPFAQDSVTKEITDIERELDSGKLKPERVQSAMTLLRGIMMGVAGNATYAGLGDLLHKVQSFIQ